MGRRGWSLFGGQQLHVAIPTTSTPTKVCLFDLHQRRKLRTLESSHGHSILVAAPPRVSLTFRSTDVETFHWVGDNRSLALSTLFSVIIASCCLLATLFLMSESNRRRVLLFCYSDLCATRCHPSNLICDFSMHPDPGPPPH